MDHRAASTKPSDHAMGVSMNHRLRSAISHLVESPDYINYRFSKADAFRSAIGIDTLENETLETRF